MAERRPGAEPAVRVAADGRVLLSGDWTLRALSAGLPGLRAQLAQLPPVARWDFTAVQRLDSFGAVLLWHAWNRQWPATEGLADAQLRVIDRIAGSSGKLPASPVRFGIVDAIVLLGGALLGFRGHALGFVALFGQIFLELAHVLRYPREWPLREVSANIHKVGVKAMPVTALVGFLIGVVLSYLSALQLKIFGADTFIVNILGLGIIRELGPVLVSVLVAGRSGSAMTAQLGVMRVTEEIDALAAMGISRGLRLVLPKVLALTLAMPLLVLWTSAVALLGGWVSAWVELDLSLGFFVQTLPAVVPITNLYIGLAKGAVFGFLIALIACHFGLRVRPNTESLSVNTTASVVTAITMVILADAVFAIATRSIGVPT